MKRNKIWKIVKIIIGMLLIILVTIDIILMSQFIHLLVIGINQL